MDVFSVNLSLIPLAVYFFLLGVVHASRRSVVVGGAVDMAALSAACAGMVFAGPMELFYPVNAAVRFGDKVWLLLANLYVLISALVIIYSRTRIVVYNISGSRLKSVLQTVASRLDERSVWAGNSLYIPALNMSLRLESFSVLNNVTLVSNDNQSSPAAWLKLKRLLRAELKGTTMPIGWNSLLFFAVFAVLIAVITCANVF